MKSKTQKKITIYSVILLLILMFLNSYLLNLDFKNNTIEFNCDNLQFKSVEEDNLEISKISSRIQIINNSGWETFKNAGNCTGEGTYSNPYIIRNLIIDCRRSGNGIFIKNTNVFFRIENCTIYNSSLNNGAGIRLYSVNNSLLTNNNCSFNYKGISLVFDCENNTISENDANNNDDIAIELWDSINNSILNNNLNNNQIGIFSISSTDNIIAENTLTNNLPHFYEGVISLISSNNNRIKNNNVSENDEAGIYLEYSDHNIIVDNILNYNDIGIQLYQSANNTGYGNSMRDCSIDIDRFHSSIEALSSNSFDISNLVNNRPVYYYVSKYNLRSINFTNAGQIILIDCHDSLIRDLNLTGIDMGIELIYCTEIEIIKNCFRSNKWGVGLVLVSSSNILISNNKITHNGIGIFTYGYSLDNIISGNLINNNYLGLHLGSHYDIIFNNTLVGNIEEDIRTEGTIGNYIYFNNFKNGSSWLDSSDTWNSQRRIIYSYNNQTFTNYLGNYWSDYKGVDNDGDGIGDSPYIFKNDMFSDDIIDNYPLMEPIKNYEIISEETIENFVLGYNLLIIVGFICIISIISFSKVKKKDEIFF